MKQTEQTESVKLNSRGQYAVMALVELARAGTDKPLPLSEISDNAQISLSYLEQLIAGMRRNGLVKSYRGPGGGYVLAKPSSEIAIVEILKAAEDSTPAKRSSANAKKSKSCDYTHALWGHIGEILAVTLNKITLEDVLHDRLEENLDPAKLFEVLSESA